MLKHMALTAALLVSSTALAQTPSPAAGTMAPPSSNPTPTPVPPAALPSAGATTAKRDAGVGAATSAPHLTAADKKFITTAASGGMAEVQAAKIAQEKSQDQKVKDFAQTMITDHTAANDKLTALAQQKGVTVPSELEAKDQKEIDKLSKLDGKKFDKAYLKAEVKDHEEMLSLLKKEAKSGKDTDLKAFAEDTIPTIQKHLDMAQSGT